MVRSRGKSRSRTPTQTTPPPTPIPKPPPDSSIRKKLSALRRGNAKTSSIVATSSIGSSSLDPLPATYSSHLDRNAIGQESGSHRAAESAWKTAYSTARMVIGFAKESSDMFLPLKAVVGALSVLIMNYDRTASNARQIGEIEERVWSLSDVLRSPLKENDHSERIRRELFCRRLMDVLDRLEPLSEQSGLLRFLRNEDHAGSLNGFVQDIAQAITDYQTSLQQGTYENTKDILEVARDAHRISRNTDKATKDIAENTAGIAEAADVETLDKLDPVRNAGYRAEHHERCLSGTRESILDDIMCWAQNPQDQPVYWLNGLAGTGKSTIAQTFSEMASDRDLLGASFFCSRDYLERKELKNIFPTLAYQLASHYPRFRDHLVKVIKRDLSVGHNSLISQLRDLVVDPLSATGISCVIVIDALDECVDDQPASAILSVLGRLVNKLPLVKFFITGRPEPRIRSGFRLPLLEPFTQVFLLHKVEPTSVGGDIRLYLTEKLTTLATRRSDLDLSEVWPSDKDIAVLVKKSSGLFIFASTVVRFIGSEHHDPRERLQLIVSKVDDTSHEGATGIDSLYSQVLRDAFSGIQEETVFVDLKRILGAVVLALNPLSRDGLVQLLDIDSTVISTRLRHLHSVILVPTDRAKEIRIFHKSFPDFLQNPYRCRDPKFHIDHPMRHGEIALRCLDLMGGLETNPCGLPSFLMNEDISDRSQRMDKLGSGLRYACKYWSTHLLFSSSREYSSRLVGSTSLFFDHAVFPWMEVMSLEGHLEGVIHSMNHLLDWLRKARLTGHSLRGLTDVTNDCLRFTLHFFRGIQLSAQHIYHTALPLSPETSILRSRSFEIHPSLKEDWTTQQTSSSSVPTTWGPIIRTIRADSGSFTHVVVAGERIAAVCEDNTVNVYDAVTGVLKLSLNPPQQVTKAESSPDGSTLFFAHPRTREITVWDTQTGGLIHTLTTGSEISDLAVSSKGKYLGSCSSGGTFDCWEVENRRKGSYLLGPAVVGICWLEPEGQVALGLGWFVVILEVTTGTRLHTYLLGGVLRGVAFSARQRKLAASSVQGPEGKLEVIDIRTGAAQELRTPQNVSSLTFSDDGNKLICATITGDLLSSSLGGLTTWVHHLSHSGAIHSVSLLRGGHLVVNSGESIHLLGSDYTRLAGASRDPEIAHVYQLDTAKAICGSSKNHKNISLLDMETMKILANHRVEFDGFDTLFTPRFLCTSTDERTAILHLRKHDGFALRRCESGWTDSMWEQLSSRPVLLGSLSPDGRYLATVSGGEDPSGCGDWELCVRGVSSGDVLNVIPFIRKGRPPSTIAFTSENQFYIEESRAFPTSPWDEDESDYGIDHEDNFEDPHVQTTSTPSTTFGHPSLSRLIPRITVSKQPRVHHTSSRVRKTFSLKSIWSDQTLQFHIEIEEVPGEDFLPVLHPYSLDENLEWVVDAKSRRVCWVPPGYVSDVENGHFFTGSSFITVGKDGIVRKLTFREPRSES